ncbi:hypothetical protein Tco_0759863 [Tanacetum coccineum]
MFDSDPQNGSRGMSIRLAIGFGRGANSLFPPPWVNSMDAVIKLGFLGFSNLTADPDVLCGSDSIPVESRRGLGNSRRRLQGLDKAKTNDGIVSKAFISPTLITNIVPNVLQSIRKRIKEKEKRVKETNVPLVLLKDGEETMIPAKSSSKNCSHETPKNFQASPYQIFPANQRQDANIHSVKSAE